MAVSASRRRVARFFSSLNPDMFYIDRNITVTVLCLRMLLTEGPIAKRLFLFTLPILFGNVLQSLSGSINAMWIGRYLGQSALTASSNVRRILFFLTATMFGFGMATTIFVGQSLGRKDVAHAKRVIGASAVL